MLNVLLGHYPVKDESSWRWMKCLCGGVFLSSQAQVGSFLGVGIRRSEGCLLGGGWRLVLTWRGHRDVFLAGVGGWCWYGAVMGILGQAGDSTLASVSQQAILGNRYSKCGARGPPPPGSYVLCALSLGCSRLEHFGQDAVDNGVQ